MRQGSGYDGQKQLMCCSEPSPPAVVLAVIPVSAGFRCGAGVVCPAGDEVKELAQLGVCPQESSKPIKNGGTAEGAVLETSPSSG